MKKALFYLVLTFVIQNGFSQVFNEESFKYWYYRDRLQYFVYPGTEEGNSVLMTTRNSNGNGGNYWEYNGAEWGQTRKINGYYIGLLATEYKLLKDNGQYSDATNTLNELNLALDALRRMDKCEDIEPWYDNIELEDGFFIRSDVPPTLSASMTLALNNGLPTGNYSDFQNAYNQRPGMPFTIDPNVVLCSRKYESPLNYYYTKPFGNEFPNFPTDYQGADYWNYWKRDKFTSNDEIIGTLMGLALVVKCVDNSPVKAKALTIATHLWMYARGNDPHGFMMRYPDGDYIDANNGGNSAGVFYGIEKVYKNMMESNANSTAFLPYSIALAVNVNFNTSSFDRGMYIKLVSTGNARGLSGGSASIIKALSKQDQWDVFYLMLWAVIFDHNLNENNYNYPFSKLLSHLETAPCSGPYMYSKDNPKIISEGWACEYKYDASLSGQQVGGDRTGVFPGADYMLLYNLACLAFPNGFDYNGQHYRFPYYVNQNNRTANGEYYPVIFTPPMFGSQIERGSFEFPEEIRAISTINSNMVVSNKALLLPSGNYLPKKFGDVTLKASESIKLTDGFRVDKGAHFLARIESYSCGGVSYKNMEAPPWDENYRGCFYDTLVSIPMDKRVPIVYSEDDYSEDDFETPLWNDYYYTYDTTSNPGLEVGVWLNPNPCQNSSTLTLVSENDTYITIELFDMGGQKRATIFEGQSGTSGFDLSIDMSPFAKGMYVVRITGDGGTKVLKIVKE